MKYLLLKLVGLITYLTGNVEGHISTPVYVALKQRNLDVLRAKLTNFS